MLLKNNPIKIDLTHVFLKYSLKKYSWQISNKELPMLKMPRSTKNRSSTLHLEL